MRTSLPVACSSLVLLVTACGGSSGGGGDDTAALEIESLRSELFAAGVQPLPEPPAVSQPLFALGQALFFDKILSGNQDVSCATCHLPQFAAGDARNLSDGVHGLGLGPNRGGGIMIPRNSPSLIGVHARDQLFWDGHVRSVNDFVAVPSTVGLTETLREPFAPGLEVLAAQAMLPPVSREEMRGLPGENPLGDLGDGYNSPGGSPVSTTQVWQELTERLLNGGYLPLFREAYPDVEVQDLHFGHVGNALAAFEASAFARTDSPFERFVRGDDSALTRAQVRGGLAFYAAGCGGCHSGALLSDQDYHNTALPQIGPGVTIGIAINANGWDVGLQNTTLRNEDRFRFRTPSLLNVALTGPYGHAGQFASLRDMVVHYDDVVASNVTYDITANVSDPELAMMRTPNVEAVLSNLDPRIPQLAPIDPDAILEFLGALTDERARDLSDVVPDRVPSGLPLF